MGLEERKHIQATKKYSLNPFYLKDLKRIISGTNTEAIFVVNILTSDLNYQLEMLRQANNIGIPIRNVEIGVDCYINSSTNLKRFPSIQSYFKEAATWKSAIEKEFIKANVTVIGALPQEDSNLNRRRNVWNSIISPQLSANAVMTLRVLGGPGLFQDSYFVNETEAGTTILNKPKLNTIDSSTVLSNAFRITNQTLEAISNLPSDKQINISEYNMYDKYNFLNGKWIQGLYAGIMTLNFLNEERINKIIYTPSPSINKNSTQSVSELAVQMITSSMSGKSNYQRLIINNNPIITDSRNNEAYFSLMGYAFSNNNRKEIILLNLSSENMNINTSMLLKNTSSLYIQYFGNPLSDKIGANGISKNKGACCSTLNLPAYSITKIY